MKAALAHANLSSRLLGAVLAYELTKDMISAGLWILQPESMMGRIGRLSSDPVVFAGLWMLLALLVAPYLVMQITGYGEAMSGRIIRLACWAILASGVFWVYLAYLSKNLDYAYVTLIFMLHGASCLAMAAILASGLNARLRDKAESAQ